MELLYYVSSLRLASRCALCVLCASVRTEVEAGLKGSALEYIMVHIVSDVHGIHCVLCVSVHTRKDTL